MDAIGDQKVFNPGLFWGQRPNVCMRIKSSLTLGKKKVFKSQFSFANNENNSTGQILILS